MGTSGNDPSEPCGGLRFSFWCGGRHGISFGGWFSDFGILPLKAQDAQLSAVFASAVAQTAVVEDGSVVGRMVGACGPDLRAAAVCGTDGTRRAGEPDQEYKPLRRGWFLIDNPEGRFILICCRL